MEITPHVLYQMAYSAEAKRFNRKRTAMNAAPTRSKEQEEVGKKGKDANPRLHRWQ